MKKKMYIDADGNKYTKDDQGNLYITYDKEEGKTEVLCIEGFQEGDYGLWIVDKPRYYLDGDKIIDCQKKIDVSIDEVFELKENEWLKKEDRIKDGFLWIHSGEKIVFPEEVQEKMTGKENEAVSSTDSGGDSSFQTNQSSTEGADNTNTRKTGNEQTIKESQVSIRDIGKNGRCFVIHGATLRCSRGTAPNKLKIIDKNKIYIQGKAVATVDDCKSMVNISSFATCRRRHSPPCFPKPTGNWKNGKNDVAVKGRPSLMDNSTIKCAFGGTIKIVNPGQKLVKE